MARLRQLGVASERRQRTLPFPISLSLARSLALPTPVSRLHAEVRTRSSRQARAVGRARQAAGGTADIGGGRIRCRVCRPSRALPNLAAHQREERERRDFSSTLIAVASSARSPRRPCLRLHAAVGRVAVLCRPGAILLMKVMKLSEQLANGVLN